MKSIKKIPKEIVVRIIHFIGKCLPDNEHSDAFYLRLLYHNRMHKKLNLVTPQTFTEKLQWLKLNNRNPDFSVMVDKYRAKEYVSNILGPEYITPTLGVWDHFDEIDFEALPEQFVLKPSHDSGGIVICKDKSKLDKAKAKQKIEHSLKRNYFYSSREWPYKNVRPCIIAEEYMENGDEGLHDYKIWCFNGKPLYIQYITGRIGKKTYEGFYDRDWHLQDFSYHNPLMPMAINPPAGVERLWTLAEQLAKGIPFVRVDFYVLNDGRIRFGEITFYPMSGMESWKPAEMDRILGDKIILDI